MTGIIFSTDGEESFRIPFPTPGIKCPETKLEIKKMTIRAEQILEATLPYTLRPKSKDRQKLISCVIREVADRLCTDLGEMECPIDKLREIADEVDAL